MTAQRLSLPDWRDNLRGLPIAAITADGIKRQSDAEYKAFLNRVNRSTDQEIDAAARSAVERIFDRPSKTSRYGRSGC